MAALPGGYAFLFATSLTMSGPDIALTLQVGSLKRPVDRTYVSPDGGHTWFPVALPTGALPDTTITAVQLAPPEVSATVWQQPLGGHGVTRLASAVIPK